LTSDPANRKDAHEVRIRPATAADARAIAEIVVRGWQAAYRDMLPDEFLAGLSVGSREVAWRMRLEHDTDAGSPAWIAQRDGRQIGFLSSGPPRDKDLQIRGGAAGRKRKRPMSSIEVYEVYAVYVDPDSWRCGAGRALLTTAVDYWRARAVTTLALWVLEDNAGGRAFYEVMGWRPDGARQLVELGGFTAPEVRYRLTS
jgi:GNAT superfamily N-acetyltransferase